MGVTAEPEELGAAMFRVAEDAPALRLRGAKAGGPEDFGGRLELIVGCLALPNGGGQTCLLGLVEEVTRGNLLSPRLFR